MVKASAGGGGRGISKVNAANDLASTIAVVQTEVEKLPWTGRIYWSAAFPRLVTSKSN